MPQWIAAIEGIAAMDQNYAELLNLASKFQDNSLGREELARLNALLRNEAALREFVKLAQLHYCLKKDELSEESQRLAVSIEAVHRSIVPYAPKSIRAPSGHLAQARGAGRSGLASLKSRRILYGSLAAAALLLAATPAMLMRSSVKQGKRSDSAFREGLRPDQNRLATDDPVKLNSPLGNSAFVARAVAATKELAWAPDRAPRDFLLRLSAGERIRVVQGILKVEFGGGALIILSGPADFEVLSSRSARLIAGSLTGRSTAGRFTLQTPKAEVIDVGTEFGVSVDRLSDTKVAVFEGEVHVKSLSGEPARSSLFRLTTGMSVKIDRRGLMESGPVVAQLDFQRELPKESPSNLGAGEASLVDVICGSGVGEYRIGGAIDPLTGHWGERPWKQPKGVELRSGQGQFVHVDWNPLVDGIFVPPAENVRCQADSHGNTILLPSCSGVTWGPVWARRRINIDLDPFAHSLDRDDEGFWGAGTITAMLDRLRWARDGLVGLHANIGVTIDLEAVRRTRSAAVRRLRGVVTLLEPSHVSQPFQPKARADFRVYVGGQERYRRLAFSREDGDAQFGATIEDSDRYLTLIVTDSGDGHTFDRVILIDPVLELSLD